MMTSGSSITYTILIWRLPKSYDTLQKFLQVGSHIAAQRKLGIFPLMWVKGLWDWLKSRVASISKLVKYFDNKDISKSYRNYEHLAMLLYLPRLMGSILFQLNYFSIYIFLQYTLYNALICETRPYRFLKSFIYMIFWGYLQDNLLKYIFL